jgi:molecular chaperone IbpA
MEVVIMRTFDLSPLFRSTVGFDYLTDMIDSMAQYDTGVSYPPYNIERTDENHYRISLAVAGFAEKDLTLEVKEGVLSVQGKRETDKEETVSKHFLHQGIAGRSFERRFQLAENVEVRGAQVENGLLHVDLERIVPDEKKPRRIVIGAKPEGKVIEAKAKAA